MLRFQRFSMVRLRLDYINKKYLSTPYHVKVVGCFCLGKISMNIILYVSIIFLFETNEII